MRSWLQADPANVAVVHCRDEMRWSSLLVACCLADAHKIDSAVEGLMLVADFIPAVAAAPVSRAQKRYAMYFDGVRNAGRMPHPGSLNIQRVIMNTRAFIGPAFTAATLPFVKLFNGGKLKLSTSWKHIGAFAPEQGTFSVNIDTEVLGDVVLELCISLQGGAVITICSYAFHTAFEPPGAVHLTEQHLDGPELSTWYAH